MAWKHLTVNLGISLLNQFCVSFLFICYFASTLNKCCHYSYLLNCLSYGTTSIVHNPSLPSAGYSTITSIKICCVHNISKLYASRETWRRLMKDSKNLLSKMTETYSTQTQILISYLFRLRGLGSIVSDGLTIHNFIFFISPPPPLPLSFVLFTCHTELFPSLSLCLNSETSAYNSTKYTTALEYHLQCSVCKF